MKNYEVRNKILNFLYDRSENLKEYTQQEINSPHPSDVSVIDIAKSLKTDLKDVKTNISWLQTKGEVKYEQFEEDRWGYKITGRGRARISEPYTNNEDEDRRLTRTNQKSNILRNIILIFTAIFSPVVVQFIGEWFFDFDVWKSILSFFFVTE